MSTFLHQQCYLQLNFNNQTKISNFFFLDSFFLYISHLHKFNHQIQDYANTFEMNNDNRSGLLRIRLLRGHNLAIRDAPTRSSDPYVVITSANQVLFFPFPSTPYFSMCFICENHFHSDLSSEFYSNCFVQLLGFSILCFNFFLKLADSSSSFQIFDLFYCSYVSSFWILDSFERFFGIVSLICLFLGFSVWISDSSFSLLLHYKYLLNFPPTFFFFGSLFGLSLEKLYANGSISNCDIS